MYNEKLSSTPRSVKVNDSLPNPLQNPSINFSMKLAYVVESSRENVCALEAFGKIPVPRCALIIYITFEYASDFESFLALKRAPSAFWRQMQSFQSNLKFRF